ncbi:hypothetical protein B0A50_00843 [Salinomyces thailandicus]|uniref:Nucleolar complex protein 2 n=1 Tax=Salinomyces thailandicus TaxID=706561 RepID=A0A4U0UCT9_9PEZI|nr:hypothetical protein B0A50_00843 [Salinomyces thailandica]
MGQSKSQKKFERNHLKDTIERRKGLKKTKQKQQLKAKKRSRRAEEEGHEPGEEDAKSGPNGRSPKAGDEQFKNMSVDEFFQGGFEVPEMPERGAKGGKRKRVEAQDEASESDESLAEEPVGGSEEDDSESDDEDAEDHKAQLARLAEKDPDFHKYLQENEPELLGGELADIGDISEDDQEEPKRKKQKKGQATTDDSDEDAAGGGKNELDRATVRKWQKALTEEHSMRAAREVVLAFRSAAHISEDEEGKEFKYSISDPEVYHLLLTTALKHVPDVFQHHMPVQESKIGKLHVPTESKKFKTLAPVLKSHVTSIIHLLDNLSDAATIRLTLGSTLPLLPYLLSFKKLIRDTSRAAANVWSTSSTTEATRIAAFLVLRRLVVIGDAGIRENALKATYQALIKGSRSTTIHTLPGINLMKTSAAELWGLASTDVAYTTAFTFIRQLAVHLRSAITHNATEGYKQVYNWQYTHSLDFWARVLASHAFPPTSPLRPLIYPLVQTTLGALRLLPTPTYFPLRFHLLRSLLALGSATKTYIPLAPSLTDILASPELRKPPKPSTLKPLDFRTALRTSKAYLRTRVYQDAIGDQVTELLSEFFLPWAKSLAFPELALPVLIYLKRWLKTANSRTPGVGNKNGKLNASIALIVQKLEANSTFIESKRGQVDFAPCDRKGVEGFLKDMEMVKLPLGAFVMGQRKVKEERAKVLEAGRREEEGRKEEGRRMVKEERAKGGEGGSFSEEEGEGSESEEEGSEGIVLGESEESE